MCGTCTYPPHLSNSRKKWGGHLQYKVEKNYHKNIHCPQNKPHNLFTTAMKKKKIGYLTINQTQKKKAVKDPCNANFQKLEDKITELSLMSID